MRRLSTLILVLLLAALPLRGMAAVVPELCGPERGSATEMTHECCDTGEGHAASFSHGSSHDGTHDKNDPAAEGSCSHCASCSVGTPAVVDAVSALMGPVAGDAEIPFRDRGAQAFVPALLDRPPLVS